MCVFYLLPAVFVTQSRPICITLVSMCCGVSSGARTTWFHVTLLRWNYIPNTSMSLMIDLIKLSCTLLLFHHFGHVQQDREESDQAKCHHFDRCTSIQDSRLIHKRVRCYCCSALYKKTLLLCAGHHHGEGRKKVVKPRRRSHITIKKLPDSNTNK